jgi:hypothetical protein
MAEWFQRCGSIISICGLLAQMYAIEAYNILHPTGFSEEECKDIYPKYENRPRLFSIAAILIVAIGTVIWGYGDLLLQCAFTSQL